MDELVEIFRQALLATEAADKARIQAKYDYDIAVNAHRTALEEQSRTYGAMVKAMRNG
jgi:hypothetical protein